MLFAFDHGSDECPWRGALGAARDFGRSAGPWPRDQLRPGATRHCGLGQRKVVRGSSWRKTEDKLNVADLWS